MQLVPDELLHQIVTRTLEHGGATVDLATGSFTCEGDFWYFPRYPSRTRRSSVKPGGSSEVDGRKIVTIYNPALDRIEYVWAGIRF
ncbi:hypothetical protein [Kribbella lupini]|uniref:Immunity protein 35 of polymorphic toxin system n=1 Tax=Kribbella lupini TaxID=291602 RepID=A0ABN2CKM2_9ACTN